MEAVIERILEESLRVKEAFIRENIPKLVLLAEEVSHAFTSDQKLLTCGNGGSAADAQHIAAEFVNRFEMERPPLPAVALTTDTSIITSIANDYSFEEVFSKQVKAIGLEGDVLLVISTSGESKNLIAAVQDARSQGLYTAAFLGKDGGGLAKLVDVALVANSDVTARVQEAHILAGHILCHLVDYILFQRHLEKK
jgi:D-sedoheptulose 7-phosphate isomerase